MKNKFSIAMSLAVIMAMLLTSLALADNLVDNATSAGQNTITIGGSTTITYQLVANGTPGTDPAGCDATPSKPVTVTINKPGAVSSPSSFSFTGCGQPNKVDITFSSNTPGSYSITHSISGGVTGSQFNNNADFTLTVNPVTPSNHAPTLSLPADITKEATSNAGAAVSFTVSASDQEDGPLAPTCDYSSGSTFPLGTTQVNCSVTDSGNLTASGFFNVTVQDTTAPTLNLSNVTAEATGPSGATVNYTASATDAVDGAITPNCSPASGGNFALGTTTVNCSATDSHSNSNSGSFTVTVRDTTGPTLNIVNVTAEATGPSGAQVSYSATATDLVDGSVTINCTPTSGGTFALGTTPVACSATDAAGNTTTGNFNVVVKDTTAPNVVVPSNITAEATGSNGAAVSFTASASDLVDGAVTPICSPASGSTFGLGTATVSCSAKDNAGNSGTASFSVTVVDTTPPNVTVPSDITTEATSASGAAVSFSASASDLVDGTVPATCTPASGSTFSLGTTTVNCSATDGHGNTGSKGFSVVVLDTTAPSLSLPANITAEATGPSGAAVSYSASASDLVDGAVTPSCSPASGSTFALGTATVNCSATDAHGNTAMDSFTVTVNDTTPPSLSLPSNISVYATGNSSAVVTYTASAADLVDGSVSVSCSPASGSSFAAGTTTVNCSATDAHNNTANGSFKVTVNYNWSGFFQPIDNNGVFNVAKSGSTIPVKFSLGGDQGLAILQTGYPKITLVACPSSASVDTIEELSTATVSGLKYDALANQYIYNWKTLSTYAGKCYQLNVKLVDGTEHTAFFKFTK